VTKFTVPGTWNNWSNGYASTVYANLNGTTETVTLPGQTRAFYLYAEGNDYAAVNITVTSNSGATLTQSVTTPNGAEGFGIFTDGDDSITTVSIDAPATTGEGGFAIGEFGIFVGAGIAVAAVPALSQSTLLLLALVLLGCGVYVQRKRHSR
jgi:hypothetical protein